MIGLKVMLLGIAFICFSGFFVVGQAAGYVSESLYSWGMVVGLLLSFLGLLVDDEDGQGDQHADAETFDSDDENSDGENEDGEKENDDPDPDHRSANRFPPM